MKKVILLLVCILSLEFMNAQITTFQKIVNTIDIDQLFKTHQTSDGGYIVAGNVSVFSTGSSHVFLMKTDANGNGIWAKTYKGGYNVTGYDMQQTPDGGYVIAAISQDSMTFDAEPVLIKTDANGDTLWTKIYGTPGYTRGNSLALTSDGGYMITGGSANISPGIDIYLIKADHNGQLQWTKNFGDTTNKWAQSICATNDGGYIITGNLDSIGSGAGGAFLVKTDSIGNISWAKTYGDNGGGSSVKQTADGSYIVTGITYVPDGINGIINHAFLFKTDAAGNLLWSKKFGDCCNDVAYAVTEDNDLGYTITGSSSGFVGNGLYGTNLFLLKTTINGVVLWCNYYGVGVNDHEVGRSLEQTTDNGYIIAGNAISAAHGYDGYLIKTDSAGATLCHEYAYTLYDSVYSIPTDTLNLFVSPAIYTVSVLLPAVSYYPYTGYNVCSSLGITETEYDPEIDVYPNPGSGVYTINGLKAADLVEIYDVNGKLIQSVIAATTVESIDISTKYKGIYFYRITNKKGEAARGKIILQ